MVSEGKCGILVMLDLSAAFDTVVHEYLMNDLKFIGVDNFNISLVPRERVQLI